MKEVKKFTCLDHEGNKPKGAIEGTRNQVLAWMKKTFPGMRERGESEMMSALEFFHEGEISAYKTADGESVYLAEVEKGQETMKNRDKENAKSRKTVASKPQNTDNVLWVWKLTWEDINELETCVTIYRSKDRAKAAMERHIHELASCRGLEGDVPKRKDALHVSLAGRFEWAIDKVKVQ